MCNYDVVMKNMTPEAMAELGVKLVNVDNRQLFYLTSSGQLFNTNNYNGALQHEYNWLMYDDSTDMPQPAEEPDCNCEKGDCDCGDCTGDGCSCEPAAEE